MQQILGTLHRFRTAITVLFDVAMWLCAFLVSAWLRYDGVSARVPWLEVVAVGALAAGVFLGLAGWLRLHQGRAATGSLEQMMLLGVAVLGAGGVVSAVNLVMMWLPRSVPAAATATMLVVAAWGRASWRSMKEREVRAADPDHAVRVLIVGAGAAGRELVGSMQRDPHAHWRPVGLLDDDRSKRRLRIRGVPVLGTTAQVRAQVDATGVDTVVLAIPSASSEVINDLRLAVVEAVASVKVLPSSTALLTQSVGIRDLRDISLADVLGRRQLDTDISSIAHCLSGRRVLVTGAGGSIGSELCRQINRFGPSELMMLDRDESALHALQLSPHGRVEKAAC